MKLNSGKQAFTLEFDEGTETIYFNPLDPELGVRMADFERNVSERTKEYEDLDTNPDGTVNGGADAVEKLRKILAIVKEEIDRAFNSEISATVFKYCSPFAIVNGDYFILQFIEGIKPEIEKRVNEGNALANKTLNERLAKYGK